MAHLNPNINTLWQRPLKRIPKNDNIWYAAAVLGHNPTEKFMGKLSLSCELSDYHTNHCIRVTGATNLTRNNFTAKQIMSITGTRAFKVCQSTTKFMKMTSYQWESVSHTHFLTQRSTKVFGCNRKRM